MLDQHLPVARVRARADEPLLEQRHQRAALGVLEAALVALEEGDRVVEHRRRRRPRCEVDVVARPCPGRCRRSCAFSVSCWRGAGSAGRGRAAACGARRRSAGCRRGVRRRRARPTPRTASRGRRRGAAGRRSRPGGAGTARARRTASPRRAGREQRGRAPRRGARAATASRGPPCAIELARARPAARAPGRPADAVGQDVVGGVVETLAEVVDARPRRQERRRRGWRADRWSPSRSSARTRPGAGSARARGRGPRRGRRCTPSASPSPASAGRAPGRGRRAPAAPCRAARPGRRR